jgi:hypothetical protein
VFTASALRSFLSVVVTTLIDASNLSLVPSGIAEEVEARTSGFLTSFSLFAFLPKMKMKKTKLKEHIKTENIELK